jgi:4-hydroxy-3-methylbut-2-enyl diphosphate reductase
VNADLQERGVRFIHDTQGRELIPLSAIRTGDVVMIPAFGAPLDLIDKLSAAEIDTRTYDTTCPFVERVWKKSEQIGKSGHTIVIHGKHQHEETRSTFSRSARDSRAVVVVRDLEEARKLGDYVTGKGSQADFEKEFAGKFTPGFNLQSDFEQIGVINQTTMLATETQEIADYLRMVMKDKHGSDDHFADTRDTLCYATNENQDAAYGLLETNADLAIVVGGYNSSNTSHLVELCERRFPTYFISGADDLVDSQTIRHYNYPAKKLETNSSYLPSHRPVRVVLSSGASCPDSLLDSVIRRINSFCGECLPVDEVIKHLKTYSEYAY